MDEYKEVRFDVYCKKCKFKEIDGSKDPCNDCLAEPVNVQTEVPLYYKEEK